MADNATSPAAPTTTTTTTAPSAQPAAAQASPPAAANEAPPTPPTDQAPPATAPAEKPNEPDVKTWETLKRKEREAGKAMSEARRMVKEIEPLRQALAEAKKNPRAVLQALGVDLSHIVDNIINEGNPPSPEDRVKQIEERLAAKEREEAERATQEADEVHKRKVDGFRQELADYAKTSEKHQLLALRPDAANLLYGVMRAHWDNQVVQHEAGELSGPPRTLSKEEAADLVEQQLEEEAEVYSSAPKIEERMLARLVEKHRDKLIELLAQKQGEPKPQTKSGPEVTPGPGTITNQLTARTAPTKPQEDQRPRRKLSRNERIEATARKIPRPL